LRIAEVSGYEHELMTAFYPGYPWLIRITRNFFGPFLYSFGIVNNLDQLGVCAMLLSNICFVLAAVLFIKISRKQYFQLDDKTANLALLLFLFCPCTVFMSAVYTESLYSYLNFACLYALIQNHFAVASMYLFYATITRSNAILMIPYFLSFGLAHKRPISAIVAIVGCFCISQIFSAVLSESFCDPLKSIEDVPPFCGKENMYKFIQREVWRVKWFGYYQLENIPHFLLAAPALYVSLKFSIYDEYLKIHLENLQNSFFRSDWTQFKKDLIRIIYDTKTPLAINLFALVTVTLVIANVNIITRLVSSSPLYYWGLAKCWQQTGSWASRVIVFLNIFYFFAGPLVHCNFLPWV
jgi:GPI mannosyltransferase 2